MAQYPFVHVFVASQQSLSCEHRSCGCEHVAFGGIIVHTSVLPPSALASALPFGSQ